MALKLSVLIATTSARSEIIKPLLETLSRQTTGKEDLVEVIIDAHETNCIGIKRNNLLSLANGEYVVSIDSDDRVHPEYISLILDACHEDTDCIGINGVITTNGGPQRQWFISKNYPNWFEQDGIYYRTPNHISPIKRELALQAMFPEISFAEDAEFSRRVHPFLKTETKILTPIYHYDFYDHK